jgi:signal transduction histidine kinase
MTSRSIGSRISIGFGVLVLTGILTGLYAVVNFSKLGDSIESIFRENYRCLIVSENMLKSIDDQENSLYSILTEEAPYEDNLDLAHMLFGESRDSFLALYEEAYGLQESGVRTKVLDSLMLSYRVFLTYVDSLERMARGGLPAVTLRSFQSAVIRPRTELLKDQCFRLMEIDQSAIDHIDQEARRATRETAFSIGIAILINLVFSVFAGLYFARNIARPVRMLTRSVQRMGGGHLYQKIDIKTKDEIGQLSAEFNKMTERLRVYDEMNIHLLIAEKMKSEAIVQSISDPLIVTDDEHRILLQNVAAEAVTAQLLREDKPSVPVTDRILIDAWKPVFDVDSRKDPAAQSDEILPLTIAGEAAYFRPRQTVITDAAGNRIGIITLLQDVTRFRNVDQLKSDFMATVSHELRTPLTSLNMVIDILRQGVIGEMNDRQSDLLRGAKTDVERLVKLVGDLLDLSRLESGTITVHKQLVPVAVLIEKALNPFRLDLAQRKINLLIDVQSGYDHCYGDFDQIFIVLTNLLSNAMRYCESGGTLSITVDGNESMVRFCVSDTGRGIPAHALESIFDRFMQVKEHDRATPGSVGLGLAISKKSIEIQGGSIWAESELGKGSRFYFTLPAQGG